MRDPHVESLTYRLVPADNVSFEKAPSVEHARNDFTLRLTDGTLTVSMLSHCAREEEARRLVEPYLKAWEIHHALHAGRREVGFDFHSADVIDRDPPPPPEAGEPQTVQLEAIVHGRASMSATVHITRGSYPEPPQDFAIDPDVETLWQRWEGCLAGREPLQSMAYFGLTVLEMHGGRAGAANRFGISPKVLSTLARLSTERGDAQTARKAAGQLRSLEESERAWLEAAVRLVIRRAGEVAADPNAARAQLTMADLPTL